jgi:uncharacterized membrane protein
MTTELSQLQATPRRLRRLAQLGYLNRQGLEQGLRLTGGLPNRQSWARFLDYSLLVLGALFFTSGLFFFVAYNWEDLPRFARFGVLEGAIVLLALIAHWVGLKKLGGKIALTVAALLVGALLAVFGQEYQTGADAYTLFGNWALLILGWVLISQFDVLWAVLLGLLNLTLALFWNQVLPGDQYPQPESLFALNAVALLLWELFYRRAGWWQHRWLNRLTAIIAFGWILWPTLITIYNLFEDYYTLPEIHRFGALGYLLFLVVVLVVYSRWQPDLFMLTMAMFSLIIVITTLLGLWLAEIDDTLAYFLTGFSVIVQAGVAVAILRRLSQRWEVRE